MDVYYIAHHPPDVGASPAIERLLSTEGGTVELPCRLPSSPSLQWERAGGELPRTATRIGTNLRVERVRLEDSGEYACSRYTLHSENTITMYYRSPGGRRVVRLTVQRRGGQPGRPQISILPSRAAARLGDRLELACRVPLPGARPRWSRVGGNLTVPSRGNSIVFNRSCY